MHPRLAVPPETHWIVALAPRRLDLGWPRRLPECAPRFGRPSGHELERIFAYFTFSRLGLSVEDVRHRVELIEPSTYADLVRLIMSMQAEHAGKERWGDKTPRYVAHIPLLNRLFPDAQFVHVIRDGRAVAASIAEWSGRPVVSGAASWRKHVLAGRRAGVRLGAHRYMEIRLEDLAEDPRSHVEQMCQFLGERYDAQQLDYHQRFVDVRPAPRQEHLAKPPTPRLRDWRAGLSRSEQRRVEALCGGTLRMFGYDREKVGLPTTVAAHTLRAVDVVSRIPAYARSRGRTPIQEV
jgi:Sulfotransferase family